MGSEAARSGGRTGTEGWTRVRDVVRDVVAEVAPEELPLVAGLAGFDDATAVRRLSGRGRRHDTLGFGLGEVAALVTPVVWLALDQAVQRIVGSGVEGTIGVAKSALRKVLRRPAEVVVIPPLTREQLAEVRKVLLEVAAQRGLEEVLVLPIADAVVTRLMLDCLADPAREPDRSDTSDGSAGPDAPDSPAGAPGGEA